MFHRLLHIHQAGVSIANDLILPAKTSLMISSSWNIHECVTLCVCVRERERESVCVCVCVVSAVVAVADGGG